MKILVVGLGLIGGSICKALNDKTSHLVYGLDNNEKVIEQALYEKNIVKLLKEDEFYIADLIMVCLHPDAARTFIETNINILKPGCIITDVCGIKGTFSVDMTNLAIQNNMSYIGVHPMAGKEHFGYEFSDKNLFTSANFIVVQTENTDKNALDTIINLAKELGFGQIISTDPFEHDRIIAYTSQLAHIVSSAYVKSPTLEKENGFSGGSFQDMTRTATLNENMWSSLFMLNKKYLLSELNTLINNLTCYRDAIENDDLKLLIELLREGRILKENNTILQN